MLCASLCPLRSSAFAFALEFDFDFDFASPPAEHTCARGGFSTYCTCVVVVFFSIHALVSIYLCILCFRYYVLFLFVQRPFTLLVQSRTTEMSSAPSPSAVDVAIAVPHQGEGCAPVPIMCAYRRIYIDDDNTAYTNLAAGRRTERSRAVRARFRCTRLRLSVAGDVLSVVRRRKYSFRRIFRSYSRQDTHISRYSSAGAERTRDRSRSARHLARNASTTASMHDCLARALYSAGILLLLVRVRVRPVRAF